MSISVKLTRGGGGMRLIVPGESGGERRATPNVGLIKAVARARVWHEGLFSGEATSLRAIAREEGLTPRYVGVSSAVPFSPQRSSTRFFKVDSHSSSRSRGFVRTCHWIGKDNRRHWGCVERKQTGPDSNV